MRLSMKFGWTLKRPDGSLSYPYFREMREDVKEHFNEDLGPSKEAPDCDTWQKAKGKGYSIVRVRLVEI